MIFFGKKKKKGKAKEFTDADIPRELSAQEIKAMKKIGRSMSEYMNYIGRPWHIIWSNILAGISRGIGVTLGVALVICITVKILTFLISSRFPWLSEASSGLMQVIKTTPGLERYTQAVEDAKHRVAMHNTSASFEETPVGQEKTATEEAKPGASVSSAAVQSEPLNPIEHVKE